MIILNILKLFWICDQLTAYYVSLILCVGGLLNSDFELRIKWSFENLAILTPSLACLVRGSKNFDVIEK